MAVVEVRRDRAEGNHSYEGAREASRIRLTTDEIRTINYVLVSWDSEVGCGSNFGAMAQAIADRSHGGEQLVCDAHKDSAPDEYSSPKEWERYYEATVACLACRDKKSGLLFVSKKSRSLCPKHEDRRPARRASATAKRVFENDVVECYACQVSAPQATPSAQSHVFNKHEMTSVERWADRPAKQRQKELRCWRAICAMGLARSPSLIILNALYGDRPPGMPQEGLWHRSVDHDYRRVVRYVDESGGSGAALDDLVRVDKHKRQGESPSEFSTRQKALEADRKSFLVDLGRSCERLIVAASVDWRVALRAQP